MLSTLPSRKSDNYGSGRFGSNRRGRAGPRCHNGEDLACFPGTKILSPVDGHVTKLGYPYGDDLSYRYVEVTDAQGLRHRLFYVTPWVEVGDNVYADASVLGEAQDIRKRYPNGMTPHVHYEIKTQDGKFLDPLNHVKRIVSP